MLLQEEVGARELCRAFTSRARFSQLRIYELADASSGLLLLRGKHPRRGFAYEIEWPVPAIIYGVPAGTTRKPFHGHRY